MRKPELIIILWIIGFISFSACKHEKTIYLKIMSYNIRHGEGMDTILDLSRATDVIKSVAPDLCGIQEVDNFCMRSGNIDQTEYIAQTTSMKGNFGKFMEFQNGEYGMATMSAKPIISTKVLKLPDGKHEPRTSIVQKVQVADDCIIAFANVHFDWITDEEGNINRLNQSKALVEYLDSLKLPVIITGDFNCSPDSPTMKYFAELGFVFVQKGEDNFSFQGENKVEIDHLIYRDFDNVKFTKKSAYLLEVPLISDHRPLVVHIGVTYQ